MSDVDPSRVRVIHPFVEVNIYAAPNGLVCIRLGSAPDEEYILVHPEGAVACADPLFKAGLNGRDILARGGQPPITEFTDDTSV